MDKFMKKLECGYLYIASGERYVKEAIISAESLRRVDKQAHITLVTNETVKNKIFNNILVHPSDVKSYGEAIRYRVRHIYETSPYKKTLFLDSDTYFYDNCRELFDLLNYYDICMTLAPCDSTQPRVNGRKLVGYTPYNCGMILFKKNLTNNFLFQNWKKRCEQKAFESNDQLALMESLLESKTRVYVLQNIWNTRIPYYLTLNGFVKIVHGRCKNYEKLRRKINIINFHRCWDPVRQKCLYQKRPIIKRFYRKATRLLKKIKNTHIA
jgi:hypothetical protein